MTTAGQAAGADVMIRSRDRILADLADWCAFVRELVGRDDCVLELAAYLGNEWGVLERWRGVSAHSPKFSCLDDVARDVWLHILRYTQHTFFDLRVLSELGVPFPSRVRLRSSPVTVSRIPEEAGERPGPDDDRVRQIERALAYERGRADALAGTLTGALDRLATGGGVVDDDPAPENETWDPTGKDDGPFRAYYNEACCKIEALELRLKTAPDETVLIERIALFLLRRLSLYSENSENVSRLLRSSPAEKPADEIRSGAWREVSEDVARASLAYLARQRAEESPVVVNEPPGERP